ncbi:hypothetical protein ACVNP0_04960 [Staphylococcus aureus]
MKQLGGHIWAQDNDIFKDQLGHLTVQLRKYPEVLAKNDTQQLVSMAATRGK